MTNLRKIANYLKIINEIRLTGGVSYNINTGELNPPYGYMVSLPSNEETVDVIDEETVASYIKRHADLLWKHEHHFGCWFDGSMFVLDVSIHCETKRDALFHAIVNSQRAVWDIQARDDIRVNDRNVMMRVSV